MLLSAIRTLLAEHQNQTVIKSDSSFVSFLQVLQEKPQWQTKLGSIQKFKITLLFGAPILSVQLNNGKWLRAAWKMNARKDKLDYQLQSAMRHAIWKQVRTWKLTHHLNPKCVRCHQTKQLQADHDVLSFQCLCKNFLDREPLNIPVTFDYHSMGRKFQAKDKLFKYQWQKYHSKNCSFQWLCRSCNVTKKHWQII